MLPTEPTTEASLRRRRKEEKGVRGPLSERSLNSPTRPVEHKERGVDERRNCGRAHTSPVFFHFSRVGEDGSTSPGARCLTSL